MISFPGGGCPGVEGMLLGPGHRINQHEGRAAGAVGTGQASALLRERAPGRAWLETPSSLSPIYGEHLSPEPWRRHVAR